MRGFILGLHNKFSSLKQCLCGSDKNVYESPTSRNMGACLTEAPVSVAPSSGLIDSLATSGCIPESLDEAARLARASGIIQKINEDPEGFIPGTNKRVWIVDEDCRARVANPNEISFWVETGHTPPRMSAL